MSHKNQDIKALEREKLAMMLAGGMGVGEIAVNLKIAPDSAAQKLTPAVRERAAQIMAKAIESSEYAELVNPDVIKGRLLDIGMAEKVDGTTVRALELLGKTRAGGNIFFKETETAPALDKASLINLLVQLDAPKDWVDKLRVKLGLGIPDSISG